MGSEKATEHMKVQIARAYARGGNAEAIARDVGYTGAGLRRLLKTPRMRELLALEEQRLDETAERARMELFRLGRKSVEVLAEILDNPSHPRRVSTARYVLDKMLPEDREPRNGDAPVVDEESRRVLRDAFMGIAQGMAVMAERGQLSSGVDRVRKGPEALLRPVVDVDVESESA